jgi:hypothetical protein
VTAVLVPGTYGRGYDTGTRVAMATRSAPVAPAWSAASTNVAAAYTSQSPAQVTLPFSAGDAMRVIQRTRVNAATQVLLVDTAVFNFTAEDYDLPMTAQGNLTYSATGSGASLLQPVGAAWADAAALAWVPANPSSPTTQAAATRLVRLQAFQQLSYSDYQRFAGTDKACINNLGNGRPVRIRVSATDGVGLSTLTPLSLFLQMRPVYRHSTLTPSSAPDTFALSQPPYFLNRNTINLVYVEGEGSVRGSIRVADVDDPSHPAGVVQNVSVSITQVTLAETGDTVLASVASFRYRIPVPEIAVRLAAPTDGLGGVEAFLSFLRSPDGPVFANRTSAFTIRIVMADAMGVCQMTTAKIDVSAIAVLVRRPMTVAVERRASAGTLLGYLTGTHPSNATAVIEWKLTVTNDPGSYAEKWVNVARSGLVTLTRSFTGPLTNQMPPGAHPFWVEVCSPSRPLVACSTVRVLLGAQDSARVAPVFVLTATDSFDIANSTAAPAGGTPPEAWPNRSFTNANMHLNGNAVRINNDLYVTTDNFYQRGTAYWQTMVSVNPGFRVSFDYVVAASDAKAADGFTFVLHNDPRGKWAIGDAGGAKGIFGGPGVRIANAFGTVVEDK